MEVVVDGPAGGIPVADGGNVGCHGFKHGGSVVIEDQQAAVQKLWHEGACAQTQAGKAREQPGCVVQRSRNREVGPVQRLGLYLVSQRFHKPLLVLPVLEVLHGCGMAV